MGYDLRNSIKRIDASISAQTVFSEDMLEAWPVREAYLFLSIVGVPADTVAIRDWLSYKQPNSKGREWKAPNRNAEAYASLKTNFGPLDLPRLLELADLKETDLTGSGRRIVIHRIQRLETLYRNLPDSDDVGQLIDHILEPERWIIGAGVERELAKEDIARLRRECRRIAADEGDSATLKSIVDQLRYRISTREPIGAEEDPAIKIVTLWGAKGLTADFVYIAGLCDEALPGPFRDDSSGLTPAEYEREQLRLLYVSLTRAKQALVMSRPLWISKGQVAALGLQTHSSTRRHQQNL